MAVHLHHDCKEWQQNQRYSNSCLNWNILGARQYESQIVAEICYQCALLWLLLDLEDKTQLAISAKIQQAALSHTSSKRLKA